MYTDEDLTEAVKKGILTNAAVESFRHHVALSRKAPIVDQEHFKLVSSFNDIFVSLACILLMVSLTMIIERIDHTLTNLFGSMILIAASWGLSEFFVRHRKMAFPAIVLLSAFILNVHFLLSEIFLLLKIPASLTISSMWPDSELQLNNHNFTPQSALLSLLYALAVYCYWKRFKVPIAIALITIFIMYIVTFFTDYFSPKGHILVFLGIGLIIFLFAMYWDISDRNRTTYRSDVAFWLHLLAAPFIVHPAFAMSLHFFDTTVIYTTIVVLALYIPLTLIALIIDRRALIVSSLVYVIYAFANLLERQDVISPFAITSAFIAVCLLLLSAFWHSIRARTIHLLPPLLQNHIPKTR